MEKSISMGSVAERLLDYIDTAMQHDTNYEIATTLVKNYSKLSELSIGEIADMCFVSKASVSRFCRFMGFADFKDLRNQLEHDVLKTGLFPHAFVEQLSNDTEGALASYREAILLNIETTISAANIAKLPAIVDDLHDSGHVAFFSHHFLWDVGRYFQSRLTIMNRPIELYLDYSSQLASAQSLTKSSLAIICSIGGTYPIRYPEIVNALAASGCRLLAITQNTSSAYWNHASCILSCGVTNNIDTGKFGALAAIDLIVMEYLRRYGADSGTGE